MLVLRCAYEWNVPERTPSRLLCLIVSSHHLNVCWCTWNSSIDRRKKLSMTRTKAVANTSPGNSCSAWRMMTYNCATIYLSYICLTDVLQMSYRCPTSLQVKQFETPQPWTLQDDLPEVLKDMWQDAAKHPSGKRQRETEIINQAIASCLLVLTS